MPTADEEVVRREPHNKLQTRRLDCAERSHPGIPDRGRRCREQARSGLGGRRTSPFHPAALPFSGSVYIILALLSTCRRPRPFFWSLLAAVARTWLNFRPSREGVP